MNVGYVFGTDPKPSTGTAIYAVLVGLLGFVAVVGLLRNTAWGIPAAVVVAGVNVAASIVAMVADSEGAVIGLAVSLVALALSLAAGMRRRTAAPA